jgi:hypothetical protein
VIMYCLFFVDRLLGLGGNGLGLDKPSGFTLSLS